MTIVHRVAYQINNKNSRTTLDTTNPPTLAITTAAAAQYAHVPPIRLLACSARTQAHLLASREINGPLCRHRKGFLDHLKYRPFITSVRVFRFLALTIIFLIRDNLTFSLAFSR
jgi:hypothetical protein